MKKANYLYIDNGHGIDTKGKRSPVWKDGSQLFEWEYNRQLVADIVELLNGTNITPIIVVPEVNDISLSERVDRVNKAARFHASDNNLFLSVHGNAGGGTGWECFTANQCSEKSVRFAKMLSDRFSQMFPNEKNRGCKKENFFVIKHTCCPAVLTENFFFDNETDCKKMIDKDFRHSIAEVHAIAIKDYFDSL